LRGSYLIVAYKNYKRTDRLLLSIASVRHFMPAADLHCLLMFEESTGECDAVAAAVSELGATVHFAPLKHRTTGPGAFSKANGLYFSEYLNYFSQIFSGETKVLAMDEDNYFTTGETLRWMESTQFDLAWARWHCVEGWGVNASILGLNFSRLAPIFPVPERMEYIETLLQRELYDRAAAVGADIKEIPTRNNHDYFGDGSWTNDVERIKGDLIAAGIIGG